MVSKSTLAAVSALGAGAAATGGVVGHKYFFQNKDSLLSKLQEKIKDAPHKKILTSKKDGIWNSWKEFYGAEATVPITGISKDTLPQWCEESLSGNDESKMDLVSKWCVVNTRSTREELKAGALELLDEDGGTKWEDAWDVYNAGKGDQGIVDSTFTSKNITEKAKGGPALKEWCVTYLNKKMYEFFEKGKSYEKLSKWCVKQKQSTTV
ncbi:hypothetical protein MHF_0906 [Mycoplasma haemofelis Ohio2]|uniref:Uncharacterized protein n=1 Tax=Mycoplasma haemofelis (strain Ohio2) TaxID=859194 RepID=F6FIW6_MYCHI|nr:hypothetical protein MHF_0906 [Mycoplasma haemofelis Ohio2]